MSSMAANQKNKSRNFMTPIKKNIDDHILSPLQIDLFYDLAIN